MEEVGKGHDIVTVVTNTTFIADATVAFANQHFESGGDVVGETCAWYATHEHLGSDRVFPCRTRKVDLILAYRAASSSVVPIAVVRVEWDNRDEKRA